MGWSREHYRKRWRGDHRGALLAGLLLLNLGLLHPLLCILHCEILLRAGDPSHVTHSHGAHRSPERAAPLSATGAGQSALVHPHCEVLPPALYALILSMPVILLVVLYVLRRVVSVVHVRAGQLLPPPHPPPIALL